MDEFCSTPLWNSSLSWDTDTPNISPCLRDTVLTWTPCAVAWFLAAFEVSTLFRTKRRPVPWNFLFVSELVLLTLTLIICLTKVVLSSRSYWRLETHLAEVTAALLVFSTIVLITSLTVCGQRRGQRSRVAAPMFWFLFWISSVIVCYSDRTEFYEGQAARALCNFCLVPLTAIQLVTSSFSHPPPPCSSAASDKKKSLKDVRDKKTNKNVSSLSQQLYEEVPLEEKGMSESVPDKGLSKQSTGMLGTDKEESKLVENRYYCVLEEWTLFPKLFFAYMWRIVLLGFRKKLELSSMIPLCTDLKCKTVSAMWQQKSTSKQELRTYVDEDGAFVPNQEARGHKSQSLYLTVFKICRREFFVSLFIEIVAQTLFLLPPIMLSFLLHYLENKEQAWHGYVYALGYAIFQFLGGLFDAQAIYFLAVGGYKVQSSLVAALYKKVFRISSSSRRRYTAGQIMNLMAVDVEEVSQFILLSTQFWSVPFRIVTILVLLWQYLGPSCLTTLLVMLVITLTTTYVARICDRFQEKLMAFKDARIRQINEILGGIKVLKLSAWEPPFMEKVRQFRAKELSFMRKYSILESSFSFLWSVAPHAAALVSFGTFQLVSTGNQITPVVAFVSLSLFNLLRHPMGILPDIISRLIRVVVSMGRLQKFLNEAELEHSIGNNPETGDSITLKEATFSWSSEEAPVLKNITMSARSGALVAVVGSVGSGKSSLLSAILGSLEKKSGSANVRGRLAYVAQQTWIQNSTLKENIIFTNPANEETYKRVVEACALGPDLEMLPGGENTEIGEKGINLSGGQKLRLTLARAVYHDADVYLLDDPFSAVDVHVASHLFEQVIGPTGVLKSKTRILVTHSLTFLPQVDWIVLLENGEIKQQGTYGDLLANEESDFSAFLQEHVKGNFTVSAPSDTDEDGEEGPTEEPDLEPDERESKLIGEEKMHAGNIGWNLYYEYMKRVGWKFLLPALVANIIAYGGEYGSGLWLSAWSSDDNPERRDGYLLGYGLFLLMLCVFSFVLWIVFMLGCLRASASFHSELLHSVMRSPLSFFDTTPMGRIVNRFSKDIESIDKNIPMNANLTMSNIIWTSFLTIVICIMSAYFVLVVVLAVLLFCVLTVISLPTFRHVQRLQSITRSPVFSHFSETISGVVSIRAFGAREMFVRTLERRVDVNINCGYHASALDCCRVVFSNVVALLVSTSAALLAVLGRESLSPGLAGLVLSYTLQVADQAAYNFKIFALLETSLVAVERVKEYLNLPEEAPWRNPETQPASEWPSRGNVVFSDYSASYRDDLDVVLRSISFEAKGGQKIGLVGRTGAGKSSLALSLFRIIESKSGSITVDDVCIAKIGLHDLRSKMSIIPQVRLRNDRS